ncbi:hypothetical protein H257_10189 [Aphanomyces astaci]|uniref:Uncharacterized protein n=1 Tax=Aphanomyces astaci TaxID=112090 RepID=W4GA43_APHAT|nr:hypothetical protein H257_10189 [Aphanomyces astaci]ETV75823.1 hypothetical protein H257_10189 [Aphanomyces astaci]|eukprot:XP_009834954.1 hypothetical protein H257_10189 [Aphanomyces astaci]
MATSSQVAVVSKVASPLTTTGLDGTTSPQLPPSEKHFKNPSRETRDIFLAIQGGKDMNAVWDNNLTFLNSSS